MKTIKCNNAPKWIITIILFVLMCMVLMSGCNHNPIGSFNYDLAIIKMPDGEVIHVEVDQFASDNGYTEIWTKDGRVYHVGNNNCVLIKEKST